MTSIVTLVVVGIVVPLLLGVYRRLVVLEKNDVTHGLVEDLLATEIVKLIHSEEGRNGPSKN